MGHPPATHRSLLHGAIAAKNGEQDRRIVASHVREGAAHPLTERVSYARAAHRPVHLEIAGIERPPLDAVQIRTALGGHHAPDDAVSGFGHAHAPLRSLEPVELEEIRLARHAEGYVSLHGTGGGDCLE